MTKKVLTHNLSEPMCGATNVKVDVNVTDGNLSIDNLPSSEQILASGTLQYMENQGLPSRSLETSDGQATLRLISGRTGQSWLRLPWATCNGATEWQIHLNPTVVLDVIAHSGGGNVKLNLADMAVTRVAADTGGGNMDLVLPDNAASLSVSAKSGAGNVTVHLPGGFAARIRATSGLGKVIVDSRFNKIDKDTYQSPDYGVAAKQAELTLASGAGNVTVSID